MIPISSHLNDRNNYPPLAKEDVMELTSETHSETSASSNIDKNQSNSSNRTLRTKKIASAVIYIKHPLTPKLMKIKKYIAEGKSEKEIKKLMSINIGDCRRFIKQIQIIESKWPVEIQDKLLDYAANIPEGKQKDDSQWVAIAKKLTDEKNNNYIHHECKKLVVFKQDAKYKKWTKEEKEKLIKLYEKYKGNWETISEHIPDTTPKLCANRYYKLTKPKTQSRV